MINIIIYTLFGLSVDVILCYEEEWINYPNPLTDPGRCKRGINPSRVCDQDRILTPEQGNEL